MTAFTIVRLFLFAAGKEMSDTSFPTTTIFIVWHGRVKETSSPWLFTQGNKLAWFSSENNKEENWYALQTATEFAWFASIIKTWQSNDVYHYY